MFKVWPCGGRVMTEDNKHVRRMTLVFDDGERLSFWVPAAYGVGRRVTSVEVSDPFELPPEYSMELREPEEVES